VIELQPDIDLTPTQAERLLAAWLGGPATCRRIVPLKGGLVNTVLRLEFDRPPFAAVVKLHGAGGPSFAREARALRYLRDETACPAPLPYLVGDAGGILPWAFLLVEVVPGSCLVQVTLSPEDRAGLDEQLAGVLLELHSHVGPGFGELGTGPSGVAWADIFVPRLLAARRHPDVGRRLDARTLARVDAAIELAGPSLQDAGVPILVHGDVWDGNLVVRQEGSRWTLSGLLDPAPEYADVEMELAYLEVFDASRPALLAAYTAVRPMRPGYEHRRRFYWLHTALVHVGLFGDPFFCEFTARTAESILAAPSAMTEIDPASS
jgi:fructosamine-3-kinase